MFTILGPLAVQSAAGDVIEVTGAKRRALLARLLVDHDRPVPAETLVDDLWAGNPPASAAGTLQSHISHLRRLLGADRLVSRAGGYALLVEPGELDAQLAEDEIAEGRRLRREGTEAEAIGVLVGALSRWRGPVLADVAGEAWAAPTITRLEELRLVGVETLLDARLATGHNGEAVALAEQVVAEHPLRERVWAQLMTALYRYGRQADALAAYRRLRTQLVDELGIEPSAELRALERAILAQDPALGGPADDVRRPTPTLPTGVVTFLVTDIVGSTRLWETARDRMPEALALHSAVIEGAVEEHGGVLLKARGEGDSTFSVFRRATDAAAAALAAQSGFAAAVWPDDCALAVRMAVHTGEALERDGDYYGPTVNRAARLRAVCEGNQVLVSHATASVVIDHLPADARLVELGTQQLRDLERPETVYLLTTAAPTAVAATSGAREGAIPFPARLEKGRRIGFVGRSDELRLLEQRAKEAAAGDVRVVLIAGEPGIGKTALAAEAARAAYEHGCVVLHGRCDEDLGMPYQPFAEALGYLVEHAGPSTLDMIGEQRLGDLARIVPTMGDAYGAATVHDPETDRWLAFGGVVAALAAASSQTPVVVVIDDLHSADKGSLSLLRHVVAAAEPLRLFVVGTYRDSELSADHPLVDTLAALRREAGVERLTLSGLGDRDLVDLFEAAAGYEMDEVGVALAHALRRDTDGNPFFVGEIVRHLRETGALETRDGRWVARDDITEIGLPDSVREVIGRRVARLGEPAQRILATAAVVGSEFDLDLVAAAAGETTSDVLDVVEQASTAALINNLGPGRFAFAHALVQQTMYADLSPTRRAAAHRAIAEAIEDLGQADTRVTEMARHLAAATLPTERARAIEYARRAGTEALRSLAPEEAARWYAQALDLLDQAGPVDESERCDLLVRLGRAQRQAGDPAFRATLLEAARLADEIGDTDQLVRAALANSQGFGPFLTTDDERIVVLKSALASVGTDDSAARARLLATLAAQSTVAEPFANRLAMSDEALSIARRLNDSLTLFQVLNLRFHAIWVPWNLDERLANTAEAVALADQFNDPVASFWAASWRAVALIESGDVEGGDAASRSMIATADELRQPMLRLVAKIFEAGLAMRAGDFEAAVRCEEESTALSSVIDNRELGSSETTFRVGVRRRQGRLAELADEWNLASEPGPKPHGNYRWRNEYSLVALIAAESGDVARAQRFLDDLIVDDAVEFFDGIGHFGVAAMTAEACARAGTDDQTESLLRLLMPYRERPAYETATANPLIYYVAILAARLGRDEEALGYFEEAERRAHDYGDSFYLARIHLEWGRLLLRMRRPGDVERGSELVRRALETARRDGYAGVEREAIALLSSQSAKPDAPAVPSRLAAVDTALVGRDNELAFLRGHLDAAAGGQRRVVLLGGEPGIGKTALAARFAMLGHEADAWVVYGRCDEDVRVPYQPFVEILTDIVDHASDAVLDDIDMRHLRELVRLVPALAERRPSLPPPQASDPETERYLLMNAVVATLRSAADDRPLVAVIDDLHWADQQSLLLLRHLVATLADGRLLLLGTFRDSDLSGSSWSDVLVALHREAGVERITIAGLAEDELAVMTGAAADLAETIHRETDGNPFFARELVRHITESGDRSLPPSVRDVIGRRVDRLGDEVANVLRVAAVIGQEFDLRLLADALGRETSEVLASVEEAESAGLVRTIAIGKFAFAHALVQRAVYDGISPTRRALQHYRVGEALEASPDADQRASELAYHWLEASDDPDRALRYAEQAGDAAMAARAPHEAVGWYRRALDVASQRAMPDEPARGRLTASLGEALRDSGAIFRETFIEAADIAWACGDTTTLVRAALENSRGSTVAGPGDVGRMRVLEQALERVGPDDSKERARLLAQLAAETYWSGYRDQYRTLRTQAEEMARRMGDDTCLLDVFAAAFNSLQPDVHDDALEVSAEAVRLAETIGGPKPRYRAFANWVAQCWWRGRVIEADPYLDEMTRIADEIGDPAMRWRTLFYRCARVLLAGDASGAEAIAEEALAVGRDSQPDAMAIYAGALTAIRWHQGRQRETRDLIAQASDETGITVLRAGREARLPADMDQEAPAPRNVWLALTAEATAQRRDVEGAVTFYERLLPYAHMVMGSPNSIQGAASHYLGHLASVLGRYDDAEAHFVDALAKHEHMQAPFHIARTHLEWGRMLTDRGRDGDFSAARDHLDCAQALAREFGCAQVERRALRLLHRLS